MADPAERRPTSDVRVVAHLVHGTWPSGGYLAHKWPKWFRSQTSWFQADSDFRRGIEAEVPEIEWRIFNWSGDNSELERRKAAGAFANQMRKELAATPAARHIVLAHSHGGNVALWGLGRLSEAELDKIGGFVTMGTPFLHFVKHRLSAIEMIYINYIIRGRLILGIISSLLCVIMVLAESAMPYAPVVTVIGGICAVVGLIVLWRYRALFMTRVSELENIPSSPDRLASFLILRSHGDEASRVIALADRASRSLTLFWFIVRFSAKLMPWNDPDWRAKIFLVALIGLSLITVLTLAYHAIMSPDTLIIGFMAETFSWDCTYSECFVGYAVVLILASSACFGLLFMMTVLLPYSVAIGVVSYSQIFLGLALGSDTFALAITTEIIAKSNPPSPVGDVEYVDPGEVKMRHSVYAMPAARSRVAAWIIERQQAAC
jgi:hypothetical protein